MADSKCQHSILSAYANLYKSHSSAVQTQTKLDSFYKTASKLHFLEQEARLCMQAATMMLLRHSAKMQLFDCLQHVLPWLMPAHRRKQLAEQAERIALSSEDPFLRLLLL